MDEGQRPNSFSEPNAKRVLYSVETAVPVKQKAQSLATRVRIHEKIGRCIRNSNPALALQKKNASHGDNVHRGILNVERGERI